MSMLEKALMLALRAHQDQTDLVGAPYIMHPLRVMFEVETEEEMIVAILHDVVEDSSTTLDDLRTGGFSERVITAVDCLSRREDESYEEFIERIRLNPLAVRVKRADLKDNMDIRRLNNLTEADIERLRRYQRAWDRLSF